MDQNEVASEQKDKIKVHFNCEKILIFLSETKVGKRGDVGCEIVPQNLVLGVISLTRKNHIKFV